MIKSLATIAIVVILYFGAAPVFADTSSLADSLFKDADSLDIVENYREASARYLELITKVRQTDPNNPMILRAQTRLARIYVLNKNFDEAQPLFHVLTHMDHNKLTVNPELMIDLDDLSDAYRQLQSNAQYGYEGLKRCVALRKFINPDHPRLREAYDDLSQYCKQHGNTKEAIEWVQKAIAQDKTFPLNKQAVLVADQLVLAEIYIKTDALDKAQQAIQEGMSAHIRCKCGASLLPQLHIKMGHIYVRRGQYDQADKELQLAEKTIPKECEIKKELTDLILRYRRENEVMRRRTQGRSQ